MNNPWSALIDSLDGKPLVEMPRYWAERRVHRLVYDVPPVPLKEKLPARQVQHPAP